MQGSVLDRPFGKTVGMMARRGVSAQLTVRSDGGTYELVFDRGYVVAASSPASCDRAVAVALACDMITPAQATAIDRWVDSVPGCDEIDVSVSVARLHAAEAHILRRRTIARCASRLVAVEDGEFFLSSRITLPVVENCEMHAGGVIYVAARTAIFPDRLDGLVEQLGRRFELRRDSIDDLPYFGFGDLERPFLQLLADGVSIDTLRSMPDADRRVAQACVYALASCGDVYCETALPSRFPRGTQKVLEPEPELPMLELEPVETVEPAVAAYQRGQRALKAERIEEAVLELEQAHHLQPNEPNYLAALAWARFCSAADKQRVAGETRKLLMRAIARSDAPIQPRYYLGLVERIMHRPDAALEQFREVIELDPKHADAHTEIRFLLRTTLR